MQTISAGTEISAYTLNPVDIAAALQTYAIRYLDAAEQNALQSVIDSDAPDDFDSEIIQETIDALNDYAAPYCVIGFHDGDGALLGCWPCLECAMEDSDVLRVNDTCEIPPAFAGFALHVNERGNATLYECHGASFDDPESPVMVEIWALV